VITKNTNKKEERAEGKKPTKATCRQMGINSLQEGPPSYRNLQISENTTSKGGNFFLGHYPAPNDAAAFRQWLLLGKRSLGDQSFEQKERGS